MRSSPLVNLLIPRWHFRQTLHNSLKFFSLEGKGQTYLADASEACHVDFDLFTFVRAGFSEASWKETAEREILKLWKMLTWWWWGWCWWLCKKWSFPDAAKQYCRKKTISATLLPVNVPSSSPGQPIVIDLWRLSRPTLKAVAQLSIGFGNVEIESLVSSPLPDPTQSPDWFTWRLWDANTF